MTTPDRVTIAAEDLRTLTGAELFAALAHAGLTRARFPLALEAIQDPDGDPGLALAGMRFLQAVALELAARNGVSATWEEAQRWDVSGDVVGNVVADPLEEDAREYRVSAAIATGLAPDVAMEVPVADVAEFARRRAG